MTPTIIDGTNQIMGRLASRVAKRIMAGETISIVNAENILISGNFEKFKAKTFIKLERGPKGNPEKGPHYSRLPDKFVKSVIRTMLPKISDRGDAALRRLRLYISVPKELEGKEMEKSKVDQVNTKTFTVGALCKGLGAHW